MKIKEFEYLIDALKSLPSISTKSANKIANYLINADKKYFNDFIDRLIEAKTKIQFCQHCNNMVVDSYSCDICKNKARHDGTLCILTTREDLEKVEESNSFSGLYYVLNQEIDYKNKNSINNINIDKIENMINNFNIKEILFATNMTPNGELTAKYIKQVLLSKNLNLDFYRLALGIPLNASIDYIDWESLKFSIKNKTKME